jgi:hypothetical protein
LGGYDFNADTGIWSASFYFEVTDNFGLDKTDVIKFQGRHPGFAAWWALHHRRGYTPFRVRITLQARLQGKITL